MKTREKQTFAQKVEKLYFHYNDFLRTNFSKSCPRNQKRININSRLHTASGRLFSLPFCAVLRWCYKLDGKIVRCKSNPSQDRTHLGEVGGWASYQKARDDEGSFRTFNLEDRTDTSVTEKPTLAHFASNERPVQGGVSNRI